MSAVESVKTCVSKYATFSGRAKRPEYWWFVLFVLVMSAVLSMIDAAIFGVDPVTGQPNSLLSALFVLAILLPLMAVGWRRLHDTGRPGWYLLLPVLVQLSLTILVMLGVLGFSGLQSAGAESDALVGLAAILGIAGVFTALVVQLVLAVLLLWWLTRPTDGETNEYGPPITT